MPDSHVHSTYVNEWMAQAAAGLKTQQLLSLFDQAMTALWKRAQVTLGDVTLMAILDRVLYNAKEKFPPFEALKVEVTGLDCNKLRAEGEALDNSELAEGIRFVIVEFLVVIGNLTAEVLSPALHLELRKVRLRNDKV